ncbi:hypothetical protein T02_2770 [Trichinella nativa]|uniref:Uncharacterized protein n=1 Tax=Trichinella nativa TaxID=6335 RepID=A0A0V1KNZ1_9BILA|nr:hypothetical protein T02_2770 [Trichinella nativa]
MASVLASSSDSQDVAKSATASPATPGADARWRYACILTVLMAKKVEQVSPKHTIVSQYMQTPWASCLQRYLHAYPFSSRIWIYVYIFSMSASNLTPCPENSPQQVALDGGSCFLQDLQEVPPSNSTRHFRPAPSPL